MYNIKMVSKMTDIPAVTIRAWERRYNVITPNRTDAGHRLYSDDDIQDLKWLKEQSEEKGLNISQAVHLLKKKKESQPLTAVQNVQAHGFDEMIDRLYQELANANFAKANTTLELAFSMFHYEEIFQHVLVPMMHKVGDDWSNGKISIAQEHFISQFIVERFYHFFRILPINPSLPKVLAICPPGEDHQIGLLLFTLFLRKKGVEVFLLGANTPIDGLHDFINENDIKIVSMSLTNPDHLSEAEDLVHQLAKLDSKLQFVLGGQGFVNVDSSLSKWVLSGGPSKWNEWFETTKF